MVYSKDGGETNEPKKIRLLATIVMLFFIVGCSESTASKAYHHLKLAREYYDSGVVYIKKDHKRSLEEYKKAYSISTKEFIPDDYYDMASLYLEIKNDIQKYEEFTKNGNELKRKTGDTKYGPALIKRMMSQ